MLEDKKMRMVAVAIVVVLLISVPLIYISMNPTDDNGDDDGNGGGDGEELLTVEGESMSLEDLEGMDTVTGSAMYQNRFGNWNDKSSYEGVPLNDLVPDMDGNDVLEVTASDGYSMKYSYEQVNPSGEKANIQGDLILAYQINDDKVPDWEDGPRIAVLPPDEEFSNDDLNLTRSLASEFNRQTSAGSLWVKMVDKIEVKEDVFSDADTALTLEGTVTHDYTMGEIQTMESYVGEGSRLNSVGNIDGPYEYKGVNVTKLVSNMYNGDDYTLEVEASDGYTMTYSYEQVHGQFTIFDEEGNVVTEEGQVTLMLAYEEIGEDELHGGPLRLVTVSEEPKITESHFWAKMVRYIRIKGAEQSWSVELNGLEQVTMDKQTFESASSCDYHDTTYEEDGDTYSGLPLWILVSAIDGADAPEGHYMFNSELAEKGYNVTVEAGDGFSATFPSQQVARNDSMLVANRINGEPLPEDAFPLRLVGEHLTGKQMIKNIVKIELTDIPQMANWTLTLSGNVTMEMDAGQFNSMVDCGAHTEYYNYTDNGDENSYEGIPLWILVGAVDDGETGDHWTFNDTLANEGYKVNVIAKDGYNYSFDISQVAHNDSIIIASRLNGEPLPEDDAPLRVVGEHLSGKQKVSMIAEIELIGIKDEPKWTLKLNGTVTSDMNAQEFYSMIDCGTHTEYYNFTDEGTDYHYKGVPLWVLVGAVDDEESGSHWTLNSTLVEQGYNVTVIAKDGYSYTFDISQIAHNDTIIVASHLNGEPLPEEDAPLRIVGEGLSGRARVSQIAEISLSGIKKAPSWTLKLNGTVMKDITSTEYNSMVESGEYTVYHNYTDEGTEYHYKGLPLWYLVGAVDDDESGDWTLNDTLVEQGYSVEVIAEDGYSYTFDISNVAHNNSIIIASQLNGEPLPEDDYPLRVVGEGLSGMMRVSMIAEIRLIGL